MKTIIFVLFITFAPSIIQATEVKKERWVSEMEIALPAAFCAPHMYFRQCFTIDVIECEEMAASVTRLCLKKYKKEIPATLTQPQDGTKWGTTVGECTGSAFETSLNKKRINSQKCNDVTNWN